MSEQRVTMTESQYWLMRDAVLFREAEARQCVAVTVADHPLISTFKQWERAAKKALVETDPKKVKFHD